MKKVSEFQHDILLRGPVCGGDAADYTPINIISTFRLHKFYIISRQNQAITERITCQVEKKTMLQKVVVGLLVLTVIGAVGVGLYDSSNDNSVVDASSLLADEAQAMPVSTGTEDEPVIAPTPTAVPADASNTAAQPQQQQLQQAVDMVGDPWTASGTIVSFSTAGMTLSLGDGSEIYVELGPSFYWQSQGVTLAVGDVVTVEGFYNGDQYHAATVIKADGSQLVVRTAEGLPLWSSGADSQSGGNGNAGQGSNGQSGSSQGGNGQGGNGQGGNTASGSTGLGQTQVSPEDWITLEGTVETVDVNGLTMKTQDGETLTFQLGQSQFVGTQGITFAPGDEISVKGFWQGTTFHAGEITKLATGERLMLLDPNGRPLWGGPGRAGSSGGQGQGGQGQGQGTNGQSGSGQGQSGNGQGNGKGYRGGR
jgi:hypothetical protein